MIAPMKFIANGPLIPGELLLAHEEGRVVFFCGAGVSYACAKLPDFYNLAVTVCTKLHLDSSHPARRLLDHIPKIDRKIGSTGMISMDKVFGLLEQDFGIDTITQIVADVLKPKSGVDLTAHNCLIRLATTTQKKVQLVTTNFDRLFSDCNNSLKTWVAPSLPNLSTSDELNGIVYLHGRLNEHYNQSETPLVLSSATFGRAYLSQGWATEFFKKILETYLIVFIGYKADDPPVSYLLEALNLEVDSKNKIFAFQSNDEKKASQKWNSKGVIPIIYNHRNRHSALWETLDVWGKRNEDTDEWYKKTLASASKKPSQLSAYKRGQIAHIVSHDTGARKFMETIPPPPAEWLCVFDAQCRYAKAGNTGYSFNPDTRYVNPFEIYGIDSDEKMPQNIKSNDENKWIKTNAWDAFRMNDYDWKNILEDNLTMITSQKTYAQADLPKRLNILVEWIAKVAEQPAALWWAQKQFSINERLLKTILYSLERRNTEETRYAYKLWNILSEIMTKDFTERGCEWYKFEEILRVEGWSLWSLRKFAEIMKPYLVFHKGYISPVPPKTLEKILSFEVKHPTFERIKAVVPDNYLKELCEILRKNIEHGILLEKEIGSYPYKMVNPITPDPTIDKDFSHQDSLSKCTKTYAHYFEKLVEYNEDIALLEFNKWDTTENTVFGKLTIWALGLHQLFADDVAGERLNNLTDDIFWDIYNQRDLLLTLKSRWNSLSKDIRQSLERKILRFRPRKDYDEDKYPKYKVWSILNFFVWLSRHGCTFSFDIARIIKIYHKKAPEWQEKYALQAADSHETRGGYVATSKDFDSILHLSISEVLQVSYEMEQKRENFLISKKPFLGLSNERPLKALAVLKYAARENSFPEWAWGQFLDPNARKNDKIQFATIICKRLLTYSPKNVSNIVTRISHWLSTERIKEIMLHDEKLFKRFFSFIIQSFDNFYLNDFHHEDKLCSTTVRFHFAPCLFADDIFLLAADEKVSKKFDLVTYFNEMLNSYNFRLYALYIASFRIHEIYYYDKIFINNNLIKILLDEKSPEYYICWRGIFEGNDSLNNDLNILLINQLLTISQDDLLLNNFNNIYEMLFTSWYLIEIHDKGKNIQDVDFNRVLFSAPESHLPRILYQIEQIINDAGGEQSVTVIKYFFDEIWPKQQSFKTEKISKALFHIIFSDKDYFILLFDSIIQHIDKIDKKQLLHSNSIKECLIEYPKESLKLLVKILPQNVSDWPYNCGKYLQIIQGADEEIVLDTVFNDLMRKYNSR